MKFIRYVLVLALFLLSNAYAQTPSQSAKFADSLGKLSGSLAESNLTLLQMGDGLPSGSADQNAISSITDILMFATSVIDRAELMATVHGFMQSPNDQNTVKAYLKLTLRYALKTNERALSVVNRESVRVKSVVVVAEIQKTRELLQSIGKEMQQLESMQ